MTISDALAVSSFTVALLAIGLSIYFYKESSNILMKAHQALSEISQKVAVVVDHSHQYTTQLLDRIPSFASAGTPEELATAKEKRDEERRQIVDEAKKDAVEEVKKLGLDPGKLGELEKKLESIITETTEKTSEAEQSNFNQEIKRRLAFLNSDLDRVADLAELPRLSEVPHGADRDRYMEKLLGDYGRGKRLLSLMKAAEQGMELGMTLTGKLRVYREMGEYLVQLRRRIASVQEP